MRPSKERLEEIRQWIKTGLPYGNSPSWDELLAEIDALQEENALSEKCWNGAEDDLNSWVDRCNSLEADRDAAIQSHLAMEMQIKEVINQRDQAHAEIANGDEERNQLKAALKACLGNEYLELIRERDELKERVAKLREAFMQIRLDPDSMEYGFRATEIAIQALAADDALERGEK